MASPLNAALCALLGCAFWSLLGYALGRRLLPRVLALGAAPVLGWAVHSAAVLPLFLLIGFSRLAIVGAAVLCVIAGALALRARPAASASPADATIPVWAFVAAAILALDPAAGILPKFSASGVHLAGAIYDHSKIAIIDAMARQGLPPVDPVFGQSDAPGHLAYYYLWHFSASELALALGVTGWEADVGLTWVTAFGSLALMMGIAAWLSKRSGAVMAVVVLAAAASVRTTLRLVFGSDDLVPYLAPDTGFSGWLFQSAWVPQHLMSASCAVLAMLLVARYGERRSAALLVTLALVVAAGFESSTYVGGVTFAIAAAMAAPVLLYMIDRGRRLRFAAGLAAAGLLAVCLAAPFVRDQLATVAARGGGSPIYLDHFAVLGTAFPPRLGRLLDLPAYWLILLPIEFPATYVAGVIALVVLLRNVTEAPQRLAIAALACLAAAGLGASWLLVGTLGSVNDLGLRAVLPAALVLIVCTAAGLVARPRRPLIIAAAAIGLVLGVPKTLQITRGNVIADTQPDDGVFAQAPHLWSAVRRYASPTARVANNPLYLQDLTPWPVNISWALLADRSSCFAGKELALAFAPLSRARREAIDAQFVRVFAGAGTPRDASDMANIYGCDIVVVVPQDGAWANDPFASSPDYRLAENRADRWRIYVREPTTAR